MEHLSVCRHVLCCYGIQGAYAQLQVFWVFLFSFIFNNALFFAFRKPLQVPAVFTILYPFSQDTWIIMITSYLFGCGVMYLINRQVFGLRASYFNTASVLAVPLISQSQLRRLYVVNVAWQVKLAFLFWLPMGSILCHIYKLVEIKFYCILVVNFYCEKGTITNSLLEINVLNFVILRGSLLEFLVAGQLEDPADTFDKMIERNMSFLVPQNSISERLFRQSPFEHMRHAYQVTVVERAGLMPFRSNKGSIDPRVLAGMAGTVNSKYTIMGERHLLRFSKKEMAIASFPHSFLYAKKSWLFNNAEPLVLRLIEAGIYRHLEEVYFWDVTKGERDYYRSNIEDGEVVLSLDHLGMICPLIVGIGVLLASSVLFLEILLAKMTEPIYFEMPLSLYIID